MTKLHEDILLEPKELTQSLTYAMGEGRAAIDQAAALLRSAGPIYITGIGSSWHAGMALLAFFQEHGRPAILVDASELLHFSAIAPGATVIVLSRSGKSIEVVGLLDRLRSAGARIIAVTNTPTSALARQADVCVPVHARFDHSVSITMYTALAMVGSLVVSDSLGALNLALLSQLTNSLASIGQVLARWYDALGSSTWLEPAPPTYFLARGASLASCHEARLLWEEAAKAPASALMTGGFRHGPQEVVRPGMRIALWVDGRKMRPQDLALATDLRRLGANVMVVGQDLAPDAGDLVMNLPTIPPEWQFVIDIIPLQLAAERLALLRHEDCDTFRVCPYIVEDEGGLTTPARG